MMTATAKRRRFFFFSGETLAVLWSEECLCLYCRWRVVDKSTMSSSLEHWGASPDLGFGELFRLMDTNKYRDAGGLVRDAARTMVGRGEDEGLQGGGGGAGEARKKHS